MQGEQAGQVDVTILVQGLSNKIDDVNKNVASLSIQVARIEQKVDRYPAMEDMVASHEADLREIKLENGHQQKEIDSLNDWRRDIGKYLFGTVGTSLLLAAMSFILNGGLNRP